MTKQQKANITAAIGTLLYMLLVVALLLLITIDVPHEEEEEGIEVAFGNAEEGGGYQQDPAAEAASMPSAAPAPSAAAPSNNDLMTQEDEESLALQRQPKQDAKRKADAEAERLRKQKEAQEEAERIAKEQQAAAEKKAKEQAAIDKANAFGAMFGNNNAGVTGSGDSQGDGHKGNPIGHGSLGGVEYSMSGNRTPIACPEPENTFDQAGKVVVNIQVDGEGNVISATIGKGTNISDSNTRNLALSAAKKAKFTKGDANDAKVQMGTLTYTFKFK